MVEIRKAKKEDIMAIVHLEQECFSEPWSYESLLESFENPLYAFFVAEIESKVIGYAGMSAIIDEAEVTNVAVTEEERNCGAGRALMNSLIEEAKERQMEKIFLEVRESNAQAIHLYESLNFSQVGYRKNFYSFPREAAVLYALTF